MRVFISLITLSLIGLIPSTVALAKSATAQIQIGTALVCEQQTGCIEK